MRVFRDRGGVIGVAGHAQAARRVVRGLRGLRERVARPGMVVSDGFLLRSGADEETVGSLAIGQAGEGGPILARVRGGALALALSGRLSGTGTLLAEIEGRGSVLQSGQDVELLLHLISQSQQRTAVNRLVDALWKVEGAYALLALSEDRLVAIRDPRGIRPLLLGRFEGGTAFATEEGALRALGADGIREVEPGEMVIADGTGIHSVSPLPRSRKSACAHAMVGLARADSRAFGEPVWSRRVALGERLAAECPCSAADVVVGLPEDGAPAALGYARVAGLPCEPALIRLPGPPEDPASWSAAPTPVAGKRVVLVTPALSTGEPERAAAAALTRAGAVEVHLRASAPRVHAGCRYGVASPSADEMVARLGSGDFSIPERLGVASFGALHLASLRAVWPGWCDACFSNDWPMAPDVDGQLPLFKA